MRFVRPWASVMLLWAAVAQQGMAQTPATPDFPDGLRREDTKIQGDPGISLFVRHVSPARRTGVPVLLVHGARVPGLASFDLPVRGGSLAGDLALAGHDVYVMDARGYGGSTRMPEMSEPPAGRAPLGRSNEIVRDILAVADWIHARDRARPVVLGWATGGHWAGYLASMYSDHLGGLVMLNALYGGTGTHPSLGRGSDLDDPNQPGRFRADFGAYRLSTAASLLPAWDRSIPLTDKSEWRSPEVAEAYVAAAMASDPTSSSRTPPSFRAPGGAMEDSFYLAAGRQLWDASLIRVPTLVIRSENDFWSRPEDVIQLAAHLVHAQARTVTIRNATHFVHLDRPERGRTRLLEEILKFLDLPGLQVQGAHDEQAGDVGKLVAPPDVRRSLERGPARSRQPVLAALPVTARDGRFGQIH